MNFVELLEKTSNKLTHTENGARAVNTTDNANLDLFATIGALRTADEERIKILFEKAYEEDLQLKFYFMQETSERVLESEESFRFY